MTYFLNASISGWQQSIGTLEVKIAAATGHSPDFRPVAARPDAVYQTVALVLAPSKRTTLRRQQMPRLPFVNLVMGPKGSLTIKFQTWIPNLKKIAHGYS